MEGNEGEESKEKHSQNERLQSMQNIKVMVRVRPLNKREIENEASSTLEIDENKKIITVLKPNTQVRSRVQATDMPKCYQFDHIFRESATQMDVYQKTAKPLVDKLFENYNSTVLCYGQTGTGKTYTITGDGNNMHNRGIILNCFHHIFEKIAQNSKTVTHLVLASYVEIYNEQVRDLLSHDPKRRLEVRESASKGVYITDLTGFLVADWEDVEKTLRAGESFRAVGATEMNYRSSRSHTIFTISVETVEQNSANFTRAKLNLVDLAGSERQSKTHATGIRLLEATKINQSLSTLGTVISALVDGNNHIPYRNSKLTRLLQDSLGGNSLTVMIATISQADHDYEETVSTLRYASRAKEIKNKLIVEYTPPGNTLLEQFEEQIALLRSRLEAINQPLDGVSPTPSEVRDEDQPKKKSKKKTETDPQLSVDHTEEIETAKKQQHEIMERLNQITNKMIVGGVNLLEKADHQDFIFLNQQKTLEESEIVQNYLSQKIDEKKAEIVDIKERYNSLQDEAIGKTKKIKRLSTLIMDVKSELGDVMQENQREVEASMETIRGLTRESQLADFVINTYVPIEYQRKINANAQWCEDIGEYGLRCIAYTGNNMEARKRPDEQEPKKRTPYIEDHELFDLPLSVIGEDNFNRQYNSYSKITKSQGSYISKLRTRSSNPQTPEILRSYVIKKN